MSFVPYVPLRNFSSYSMLESSIEPESIPLQARKIGSPAAAMVDRNGLYGVMAFQRSCLSNGIQPIIGAMLAVARPNEAAKAGDPPQVDWLALYAQDDTGFANLCQLVSAAHLDRPVEWEAHVPFDALEGCCDGLIALTGGADGALARLCADGQNDAATDYLGRLEKLFGDRLYIELSRRGNDVEKRAEAGLLDMAYARDIPIVGTNPAKFAEPAAHSAHDTMRCIANGDYVASEEREQSNSHDWMKPATQMVELFADLPEAIANTVTIAKRCATLAPERKPILPSLAGDFDAEAEQLRVDAAAGLDARLALYDDLTDEQRTEYQKRLERELDIIVEMGFPGYFLIVADFIKWAKDNGIPVGPGRGSGAGSLVAWSLTITDLDPIKLGLLFERFLNPERVSMPDFDIDFCETRRGEVIRYVQEKYGRDHVAQIITFGKMKARAVLRDTGRVLQMGYNRVDRLCKLVPNHPTDPWTLDRALFGGSTKDGRRDKPVAELKQQYEDEPQVRQLFDLSRQLEGLPRHSSTHAAGVVIGDRPLHQLVPLYRDPRSDMPVTQFDMKYVEDAGLVKFDFLGLKTLSVLDRAVKLLAKRDITVDLATLEIDDPKVFELLQRGDTVGVFQLESEGMRRTLSAVRPTNFGDIIALVSLYRPGPMQNIELFGQRKNGEAEIRFPHPLLADILAETYGIFVYQEQVMQAAQVLAGYTLGGADLLRRAMGKKKQSEMDKQRAVFVAGCAENNNIGEAEANTLFDEIDKFAGYGFNKSHAAAYALLAYQTAWVKTYHPEEFFAASMCYDMHQTDKLSIFVDDMRRSGVNFLPPSVNHGDADFTVEQTDDGLAVRYALAGLKNVGEKAMASLANERKTNGPFTSLDDFAARIDPTLINRRSIENLVAAGAFDDLGCDRAQLTAGAELVLATAQQANAEKISGQGGLFGESSAIGAIRLPDAQSWSSTERLARERDAFGFYYSGHPTGEYREAMFANGVQTYDELMSQPLNAGEVRKATMGVLVESLRWRESRRGNRFAMCDFSDSSGQFSANCFSETDAEHLAKIHESGGCALISVELERREGDDRTSLTVRSARPIDEARRSSDLRVSLTAHSEGALERLALLTENAHGGNSHIHLNIDSGSGQEVEMLLGTGFAIDSELLQALKSIEGAEFIDSVPLRTNGSNGAARLRLVAG